MESMAVNSQAHKHKGLYLMDDILDMLTKERDELRGQVEPLKQRLDRLNIAISALEGKPSAESEQPRKRNRNVRNTVLEIIGKAGTAGVSIPDVLEEAERSGSPLEKSSVSTLVSTLKRSGAIIVDDGKYKISPAA